jgi:hypothetical protein
MFRFTQEPSSGSSPVLRENWERGSSVLVGIDAVNVMVAYQPVVQACGSLHACTMLAVLAKHRTAPWWWFLRQPKHVGASVIISNCFRFYNSAHQLEQ